MQQQQDSVGLVLFSNKIDKNLKAKSHPSHMKLIFHELEQTEPDDIDGHQRSLFSAGRVDPATGTGGAVFRSVSRSRRSWQSRSISFGLRKHEVVVFHVMHHDELEFPFEDNTLFRGIEVNAELHTEPRALRKSYLEAVERYLARVKKVCAAAGVDHVLLDTSKPLGGVLSSYLNFRAKSRRKLI